MRVKKYTRTREHVEIIQNARAVKLYLSCTVCTSVGMYDVIVITHLLRMRLKHKAFFPQVLCAFGNCA